jgi:hypothetical protein
MLGFDADWKGNKIKKSASTPVHAVRANFAQRKGATYAFARRIASWVNLGLTRNSLLWITENGIWPPSENLHLYYRLRQSYEEHRPLVDAPGHQFMYFEEADLATFIDLVIQFGWSGFLFGSAKLYMTISHDEWILVECEEPLDKIIVDLENFNISYNHTPLVASRFN